MKSECDNCKNDLSEIKIQLGLVIALFLLIVFMIANNTPDKDIFLNECKNLGYRNYYIDRGTIGNTTLTNIICSNENFSHIYQIFVEPEFKVFNKSEFWKEKKFMYELNFEK